MPAETEIARGPAYNTCFGCGADNEQGLRMTFRELEPGLVETRYTVPDHFRGPDGVIHGGIQATLLDEILGMAVTSALGDGFDNVVTAAFSLRYKRPAPTVAEVLLRARYDRAEGRNHFVTGELLDADGNVCTIAEARWVAVSAD
jgi:acyl-coenzyme A thioesterase PaaI-like protein